MRLLYVSNFEPNPNAGASGTLLAITGALRDRGHQVDIIWRSESFPYLKHQALDEIFTLPYRQYHQVTQALQKKTYDVVSLSQPFAYLIYERLPPNYPNTLFLNRTHGWESRVYACRHRWEKTSVFSQSILSQMRQTLTEFACMRTAHACQGLIAPSHNCTRYIVENYGQKYGKVFRDPHGLYKSFLAFNYSDRTPSKNPKILYVGNYLPIKGSQIMEAVLPSIAKRHLQAEVTFVVPSNHAPLVEKFYRPAFENRLKIFPWMDRENLIPLYASHDILLFPSQFEGFGKTFLEGMACGMCIVGFEEGGLPDLTVNGKDALFCRTGDITTYEKLLDQAIANPEKAKEIGQNAYAVARNFTWEHSAEALEKFCRERRKKLGMPSV